MVHAPVAIVDGGVRIKEKLVEHLGAFFPRLPEIAASEEARNGVARQVMNPALLGELSHRGIDPRVAGARFLPRGQQLRVLAPRDLTTDGVARHALVVGRPVSDRVVELTPEELAVQGRRRL